MFIFSSKSDPIDYCKLTKKFKMDGIVNYGSDEELESPINVAERRTSTHRNGNKYKSRNLRRSRSGSSSSSSEAKRIKEDDFRSSRKERNNKKESFRCKESVRSLKKSKYDSRERAVDHKQTRVLDKKHEKYHTNVKDGVRSQRERHDKKSKSDNKFCKNEKNYVYYKQDRRKGDLQESTQYDERNHNRHRRHRESDSRGSKQDKSSSQLRKDSRWSISPSPSHHNSLERQRRYSKSRSNSPAGKTKSHKEYKQLRDKNRDSGLYNNGKNANSTKEATLSTVQNKIPIGNTTSNVLMNALTSTKVESDLSQLPKYYNPSAVNPSKYAEQIQKRKLLWSGKKGEDNASKWGTAQFSQDSDGKVASKFMRLMGIKNSSCTTEQPSTNTDAKTREDMFTSMEQQYEVARQATHTMRGVGLGFSSQSRLF